MGEAKRNINSMLKKQGLLPPKEPNLTAEERRILSEEAFIKAYGTGIEGLIRLATKRRGKNE